LDSWLWKYQSNIADLQNCEGLKFDTYALNHFALARQTFLLLQLRSMHLVWFLHSKSAWLYICVPLSLILCCYLLCSC